MEATDRPMASQNALPKASSAHARQFDGSPEQEAVFAEFEDEEMENTGRTEPTGVRRRSGTGAWYSGRLSRIDGGEFAVDAEERRSSCMAELPCCPEFICDAGSDTRSCSETCCIVISLQTQDIDSLQKPHERGPPSKRELFASTERSKTLVSWLPPCVS